eukprot:g34970.t1
MGYEVQIIDRQFRCVTVKNHNDLLRRQTRDMTNSTLHCPVLWTCRNSATMDQLKQEGGNHAMFFAAFSMSAMTANILPRPSPHLKQQPNLKKTIVRSKLPSLQENSNYDNKQPCYGNLCKTCQIIDMDTTITFGNTTHQ